MKKFNIFLVDLYNANNSKLFDINEQNKLNKKCREILMSIFDNNGLDIIYKVVKHNSSESQSIITSALNELKSDNKNIKGSDGIYRSRRDLFIENILWLINNFDYDE